MSSASEPTVLCGVDARGVATVTLNRPELHNAFDDALIAALTDTFRRLDTDPRVRVVVLAAAGRSCTGRAIKRQRAVFAEAGANGLLDDASVAFHVDGVCRAAAQLGMIDSSALAASPSPAEPVIADSYHWLAAETEGWCDYFVQAGERVQAGQVLAQISDDLERPRQRLLAPQDGIVLWRDTHPLVSPNAALFGIGGVASWPEDRP